MTVEIIDAVCPVDAHCYRAFADIYNIIVLSQSIVELNDRLIADERVRTEPRLSAWFKWQYTGDTFVLRQRTGLYSELCFTGRVLEVKYRSFVAPDRRRTVRIEN
jgi:hypothetical protein